VSNSEQKQKLKNAKHDYNLPSHKQNYKQVFLLHALLCLTGEKVMLIFKQELITSVICQVSQPMFSYCKLHNKKG